MRYIFSGGHNDDCNYLRVVINKTNRCLSTIICHTPHGPLDEGGPGEIWLEKLRLLDVS